MRVAGPPARGGALPLAVCLAVSLPWFLPSLAGEFLTWDDDRNFLQNPAYRGLDGPHLAWMLTSFHLGHYQPLAWLSLALDHAVWGMRPLGYHLTNLALHALNATLLYFLARRLLRRARPDAAPGEVAWAAAFGAASFAVHPLRVESVVWITERRQLLSTALLLAATHGWLAYRHAATAAGARRAHAAAVVAHAASLLTAAWSVVLPPVLVVLDWFLAQPAAGGPAAPRRDRRRDARALAPFVLVGGAAVAVGVVASAAAGATRALAEHGMIARALQSCYGLVFYLAKTVAPTGLSPLHELEADFDPLAPVHVGAAVAVAAATGALFLARRRRPGLWAAWLVYGLVLAPALGVFQIGGHKVADRYSYLAAMPLAVVVAAGALDGVRALGRARRLLAGAVVAAALVLGPPTVAYARNWRDSVSLWRRAVAVHPDSYIARTNLGHALELAGRRGEAIAHYRRAVALRPRDVRSRYKLGLAYAHEGRYPEAIAEFRRLVEVAPAMAEAHFCLGLAAARLGRPDDAAAGFARAVALQPTYVEAHRALADALRALGRPADAARALAAAQAIAQPYRPME